MLFRFLPFVCVVLKHFQSWSDLCVVGRGRGEELDARFSHRLCCGHNIFGVQPYVLNSRGPVLLQEGVNLISAYRQRKRGYCKCIKSC